MNYQELAVHPLSRKVIITEYGSDHLHLKPTAILTSLITAAPCVRRVETRERISVVLPEESKILVHPNAGWTLYRLHMHQLYAYMNVHRMSGMPAYTAMRMFYAAHDLDDDDLPFDRTYKVYQRATEANSSPKRLVNIPKTVLANTSPREIDVKECINTLAEIVQANPEAVRGADGLPEARKIKKLFLHIMVHIYGMTQKSAADILDMTQQNVSDQLSRVKKLLQKVQG